MLPFEYKYTLEYSNKNMHWYVFKTAPRNTRKIQKKIELSSYL